MEDDGRVMKGDPMYDKLEGIWIENKRPGQIALGGNDWKVILPEGVPIFIPIKMGLNDVYAQTSGGISRGRK